jgi:hypothetical protein
MLQQNYASRKEKITLRGKKKLRCTERRNYAAWKEEIRLHRKKKLRCMKRRNYAARTDWHEYHIMTHAQTFSGHVPS